jgi:hypothetical protein
MSWTDYVERWAHGACRFVAAKSDSRVEQFDQKWRLVIWQNWTEQFYPEGGGHEILRNVGVHLPDYTVS